MSVDVENAVRDLKVKVGAAVRACREEVGMSLPDVGKAVDASVEGLCALERGETRMDLDTAFRALFAVGGTLHDLADRK